jgi:hypothetical protein
MARQSHSMRRHLPPVPEHKFQRGSWIAGQRSAPSPTQDQRSALIQRELLSLETAPTLV